MNLAKSLFLLLSSVISFAAIAPIALAQSAYQVELLRLVNAERGKQGLQPLKLSNQLDRAAQNHAQDMATKNYFDHTGKNGSKPGDRAKQAGYNYNMVGENIAAGTGTAQQTFQGWMNSPGHRANILNPGYSEMGLGKADNSGSYGNYWVQVFGNPNGRNPNTRNPNDSNSNPRSPQSGNRNISIQEGYTQLPCGSVVPTRYLTGDAPLADQQSKPVVVRQPLNRGMYVQQPAQSAPQSATQSLANQSTVPMQFQQFVPPQPNPAQNSYVPGQSYVLPQRNFAPVIMPHQTMPSSVPIQFQPYMNPIQPGANLLGR